MKPTTEEITSQSGKAALTAVANEIREARRRAEEQAPPMRDYDPLSQRFQERRARARAVVSEGMNKARETWIGTRWYARSHRSLVATVAVGIALVAVASVAVALSSRED